MFLSIQCLAEHLEKDFMNSIFKLGGRKSQETKKQTHLKELPCYQDQEHCRQIKALEVQVNHAQKDKFRIVLIKKSKRNVN